MGHSPAGSGVGGHGGQSPGQHASRRNLQVDFSGSRTGRSPSASPDRSVTPTSPYSVPQIAPMPSSKLCPVCTSTELSNPPAVPNYNTCTQCKATVCNQCGFNPNPHLTEVQGLFIGRQQDEINTRLRQTNHCGRCCCWCVSCPFVAENIGPGVIHVYLVHTLWSLALMLQANECASVAASIKYSIQAHSQVKKLIYYSNYLLAPPPIRYLTIRPSLHKIQQSQHDSKSHNSKSPQHNSKSHNTTANRQNTTANRHNKTAKHTIANRHNTTENHTTANRHNTTASHTTQQQITQHNSKSPKHNSKSPQQNSKSHNSKSPQHDRKSQQQRITQQQITKQQITQQQITRQQITRQQIATTRQQVTQHNSKSHNTTANRHNTTANHTTANRHNKTANHTIANRHNTTENCNNSKSHNSKSHDSKSHNSKSHNSKSHDSKSHNSKSHNSKSQNSKSLQHKSPQHNLLSQSFFKAKTAKAYCF
ncbi:hypothetical protein F2P81_012101 [Scophthalmus maximus]|uniref:Zinc finger piccolo-type domain-containing protein n=1 Tax=Scophthalmus maximus TaxID=52904 RepID=A0A6A4SVU5_SCOMX|nr:hypothetical protein F2P81_012101 [Scophthalmus maximus]